MKEEISWGSLTKTDFFCIIKDIILNFNEIDELPEEDQKQLAAFIDKQIAQINKKSRREQERAKEKKNRPDEIQDQVCDFLFEQEEWASIDDIIEELECEEATPAKIVVRVNRLIKQGLVEKAIAKSQDNKRFMVYRARADKR